MPRRPTAAVLIPVLLVLVAGGIRLLLIGHPDRIIFDETYYVNDARAYLERGVEEGFAVHPPVGKWLIAAGIAVLGDDPVGWRISTALAGTALVLLTYLIGVRLLRWRGAAALAGLLVAVDGLAFVQSRTSMLDIFLAAFVAAGAWLLLVDFDRSRLDQTLGELEPRRRWTPDGAEQLAFPRVGGGADDEPPGWDPSAPLWGDDPGQVRPRPRPPREHLGSDGDLELPASRPAPAALDDIPSRSHALRLLAGVAFGLAIATKWSGLLALAAAGLVVIGWELAWRRRLTGRMTTRLGALVGSVALTFVVIPLGVYALSYVPWLVNYADTTEGADECPEDGPCRVSPPDRVAGLARYHKAVWDFHVDLDADHPYRAPAATWPVLGRPVVYYWENCDENRAEGVATTNDEGELEEPEPCIVARDNAGEIIALGNPGLWWVFLLAGVPLVAGAAMGDRRAWFILAFWGVQFLPWLLVRRPVFFFYMTPVVAFLALGVAYATVWIDDRVERRADASSRSLRPTSMTVGAVSASAIGLIAVGLFIYFYPVYAGIELDYDAVAQRWWFDSWV